MGTTENTLYSWPSTASVELCTVGSVQLNCPLTILDTHPSQELRPLLENFITVLLKALEAFKEIIQDNIKNPSKGKGKARVEDPKTRTLIHGAVGDYVRTVNR